MKLYFRYIFISILLFNINYRLLSAKQANDKITTQESIRTTIKPNSKISGKVVYISDGDSFHMLSDDRKYKVRIYGIDAPEMNQEYGLNSKQFINKLIYNNSISIYVKDIDKYNRLVAEVLINNKNLGLLLIKSGNAWWYKYYAQNELMYEQAEITAKSQKVGLWKNDQAIPPWQWRRNHKISH